MPLAGAEQRGSGPGVQSSLLPSAPTKQAPLLGFFSPCVFIPRSFSQAEVLGLPNTPAWDTCSKTSVLTLRAVDKKQRRQD